ncbi:hypothetical protein Tco_1200958 [Tanacetum coccineum]
MNIDNSSSGTTPIIDKIRKFEDLLTSGQVILVDKAGNHLKKVQFPGEYDSEDGVASVDNDMAHSMASEMVAVKEKMEKWVRRHKGVDLQVPITNLNPTIIFTRIALCTSEYHVMEVSDGCDVMGLHQHRLASGRWKCRGGSSRLRGLGGVMAASLAMLAYDKTLL